MSKFLGFLRLLLFSVFNMFSTTCQHDYLYHLLQNDENEVKTNGISATHPDARLSPEQRIYWEGKQPTQFITTFTSLTATENHVKNSETGRHHKSDFSRYCREIPTLGHPVQPPRQEAACPNENNSQCHPIRVAIIKCQNLEGVE